MQKAASINFYGRNTWLPAGLVFGVSFFLSVKSDNYFLLAIPFILLALVAARHNIRNLFWLLIICLPLSAEYQFSASLGTDLPDEFLMIALSMLFIAWCFSKGPFSVQKIFHHRLIFLLLVYLAWLIISTIFSQNILVSVKFFLAKTWYIIPFVLLPQFFLSSRRAFLILSLCLLVPMVLVTIVSLIRHSTYGFSFDRINDTVNPFFRNHVNYGAMLLCMIPVAIALLTVTGSLVQKRILQFVILILLAGLFFSYSRGAWLALLTGLLAYAAISKKFIMRLLLLFAVSGTLLICWLGYNNRYLDYAPNYRKTIYHADFAAHMKATYQFRDLSTAERFYRWVAGMRMITEHPLTGFGPNNFVDYYHRYTVTSYQTYVSRNTERSTAHNYFLLTTIEQGIPGLLILLIIIGSMFSMTQRIYANSKDKFIRTTAITSGVILMMIVTLNMLSDLVETDKIGSIFFLLMGVLIKLDDNRLPAG